MCGIAALIRTSARPWGADERGRMGDALRGLARRGPDGEGVAVAGGGHALLGHRRLAIQDLSTAAAQPMATPDGSLSLIYNGEIYNAPELRRRLAAEGAAFGTHSDTEVLLHALERWGLDETLEALRGMFAFIAVCRREGETTVMAATDHVGMKPLAWRFEDRPEDGPSMWLASECDALRSLLSARPSVDLESIRRVLSIGYCPAPWTMWAGVRKLAPGTCLTWTVGDAEGPRVRRWWRPPEFTRSPDHVESAGQITDTLGRIAREHLIGDVPVGMFLSAGLDSSAIALSLRHTGAEVSTIRAFTLATGDASDEDALAGTLASRLGMPWRRVGFPGGDLAGVLREAGDAFDEPQGFTAILTATRIARAMRTHEPGIRVVLGGDGGDEALGGYAWHRDAPTHPLGLAGFTLPTADEVQEHERLAGLVASPDATSQERTRALLALGRLSYTHRYLVRTFGGFHPAEAAALVGGAGSGDDFASWLATEDRADLPPIRRAQRMDVMGLCAGSILPKLDRACMAVGLELRSPFLDRRVLEAGLSAPVEPNEHEATGSKPALRRLLSRGVEDGLVPRAVLSRPKQGFSLRLPSDEFEPLHTLINDSRLIRDGVLRSDWARFLTSDPESRRVRLFTLAMLATWHGSRAEV